MSSTEDEVTKYEKTKRGVIKEGIKTIVSSVKWIFVSILTIAYIVVYGLRIPQEDVTMLSVVFFATVALFIIVFYIIIDTKWDQRRRRKDKDEINKLKEWKKTIGFNVKKLTGTLKGTIQVLKENSDKAIYLINKPTALLTETNSLFEKEFGWTHEEINEQLEEVEYEERPRRMVGILVRRGKQDTPMDVEELISSRIFNGNRTRGRLNDIWLCRKDQSDFSADMTIESIDDILAIGFVKNIEKEKHRQATDEAVYQILLEFKNHIEGKKNSKVTLKAMSKHLDMMRSKSDGKKQ